MTEFETSKLIELALKRGDEISFGRLHSKMYPYVFSVAFSITRNQQLSEDIAQAVFLILHKQGKGIRTEPALMSWLWKTARFTALRAMRDDIRRQKRETTVLPDTVDNSDSTINHLQVMQALNSLGSKDRNIVVMRYINEYSVEEVANANGMSVSAAQMRITRALDKLRKHSGLLSIALVISALNTKSAYASAIPVAPTLKTASAAAIKLSQPVGLAKLTLPIKVALASNPAVTGLVTSTVVVGGGVTAWYFAHPTYPSDVFMTQEFERQFAGRYEGEIYGTTSRGGTFRGKMIAVVRREKNPDRIVLRSQYGDREVATMSMQFIQGTKTFRIDGQVINYQFDGNVFSFSGTKDVWIQKEKINGKEIITTTVYDVAAKMEMKDEKFIITRNLSSDDKIVENMSLTRK
jgi:RNA polymerase sigma-70 factor, ECF subfamily